MAVGSIVRNRSPGREPLHDITIEAGDDLSANCLTQDLSHGIASQGCDLVDVAQLKSAEFLDLVEYGSQLLRIDRCRGFDHDMDFFLAAVVWHGQQTDAADTEELTQPILNGRRGNLFSSYIEDVRDASLQCHATIGSDDGQIARVKEAVLEERARRCFVKEIAGWPACCAYPHAPGLARRHRTIGFVYDLDLAAWYEPVPAMVLRSIQGVKAMTPASVEAT